MFLFFLCGQLTPMLVGLHGEAGDPGKWWQAATRGGLLCKPCKSDREAVEILKSLLHAERLAGAGGKSGGSYRPHSHRSVFVA